MNHRNLSVVFLYTTPAAVQSCANSLAFSVQKPKLKLIYDDTTENVNEQKTDLSLIASLIIQYFVIGHGAGIYTILYRAAAFLIVVYFLNLLKIILAK